MPKRSAGIDKYDGVRGTTWRVRIQSGTGKPISKTFKRLKDAEAWRTEQLAKLQRGELVAPSDEPFGTYLEHWLETHDLAPNSRARYQQVIRRRVLPALGEVELGKLTGRHIQDVYNAARGSRSAGQLMAIVNGALRLAVREGLIARNVADGLSVPRGDEPEEEREPNVWSTEQVRAFLSGVEGHHLFPLFHLLAYTGLRVGEAIDLKWEDVSLDMGLLRVRRAKSAAGRRRLALDAGTVAVLRRHKAEQEGRRARLMGFWHDEGHVFERGNGEAVSPRTVEAVMARVSRQVGLSHGTPHLLRHSYATNLARAGVPLTTIQQQLGHASYVVTSRFYVHSTPADSRSISDIFARLMEPPEGSAVKMQSK